MSDIPSFSRIRLRISNNSRVRKLNLRPGFCRSWLVCCFAAVVGISGIGFSPYSQAQQIDAWFGRVHDGISVDVIEDGVLVVENGMIKAVGNRTEVEVPSTANRHQLGGMMIVPGMVIAQSGLADQRAINETLTPQVKAISGFDFLADRSALLAAGITTVQISPAGNRMMPGVSAVVKLAGGESLESGGTRILKRNEGLRLVLNSNARNAPTIFEPPVGPVSIERPLEPTRPQVSNSLSGAVAAVRSILKSATSKESYVSVDSDQVIDAVARFLADSKTLRVSAETEAEIRVALDLAHEFGLRLVLVDCKSVILPKLLEIRKQSGMLPQIGGFVFSVPNAGRIGNVSAQELESERDLQKMVRHLIESDYPVAFIPTSDNGLNDILFATTEFLGTREFTGLTRQAAEILGVSDRVGTLEPGKDADFVVVNASRRSAQPLTMMTFVNGQKVYDRNEIGQTTLIRAGQVYLGDGHMLNNAELVIKEGTIRGIGDEVSAPLNATTYDFKQGVVIPGLIDMGCGIGTGSAISGNLALNTDLSQQLYPDDPAIKLARDQGVTLALVGSMNSNQPTPLIAIKLGEIPRVVKQPAAIRFSIGSNAVSSGASLKTVLTRGKQYADSWIKYEQDLKEYEKKKAELEKQAAAKPASAEEKPEAEVESDAKNDSTSDQVNRSVTGRPSTGRGTRGGRPADESPIRTDAGEASGDDDSPKEDKKTDHEKPADQSQAKDPKAEGDDKGEKKLEPPKQPTKRPELEPYRELFAGTLPAFVEARTAEAIEVAIQLFRKDFDIQTVICGADGLTRFPKLLKDSNVGVVAGPQLVFNLSTPQQPDQRVNLAEVLATEQIRFGFQSQAASGVARLPQAVRFAINQGLSPSDGLRALTSNAAPLLLDEATGLGSIKVGGDADLVVLDGSPLEPGTEILAVMIDGQWVYRREEK